MSFKDKFTLYCMLLYYLSSVYNVYVSPKCIMKPAYKKWGSFSYSSRYMRGINANDSTAFKTDKTVKKQVLQST